MKVLCFGSLNIDMVYQVDHIVNPGETIAASSVDFHSGGKGLNQSVALSKAGSEVWHAGMVGEDGDMLLEELESAGVDTSLIERSGVRTGNAIIQVDALGQNSIVLFGGANQCITEEYIDKALSSFGGGDVLLLQNEINRIGMIIDKAARKGLRIVLNPSPFNEKLLEADLSKVSLFLINEVEGAQIAGAPVENAADNYEELLEKVSSSYPSSEIVMTLGSKGCVYRGAEGTIFLEAEKVRAVDTTAAGDTFTGYFITEYFGRGDAYAALDLARRASAIAVTRPGAAESIPFRNELEQAE